MGKRKDKKVWRRKKLRFIMESVKSKMLQLNV